MQLAVHQLLAPPPLRCMNEMKMGKVDIALLISPFILSMSSKICSGVYSLKDTDLSAYACKLSAEGVLEPLYRIYPDRAFIIGSYRPV